MCDKYKILTVRNTRIQLTSPDLHEQQKDGILPPKLSRQRTTAVQELVGYCCPLNTAAKHTHSPLQLHEHQVLPADNTQ
jgi:hypothetical protein